MTVRLAHGRERPTTGGSASARRRDRRQSPLPHQALSRLARDSAPGEPTAPGHRAKRIADHPRSAVLVPRDVARHSGAEVPSFAATDRVAFGAQDPFGSRSGSRVGGDQTLQLRHGILGVRGTTRPRALELTQAPDPPLAELCRFAAFSGRILPPVLGNLRCKDDDRNDRSEGYQHGRCAGGSSHACPDEAG